MANNDELVKLIIDGENLLSDDINEAIGDLEKLSKESKQTSDALNPESNNVNTIAWSLLAPGLIILNDLRLTVFASTENLQAFNNFSTSLFVNGSIIFVEYFGERSSTRLGSVSTAS